MIIDNKTYPYYEKWKRIYPSRNRQLTKIVYYFDDGSVEEHHYQTTYPNYPWKPYEVFC